MFAYNLKLALKSMRRNPVMTALMVAAIAVGIGISMTTLTVHHLMSSNPIPQKSNVLFAVTLDSWNPLRPFDDDRPERAPHQLTYRDAQALHRMAYGRRQTAMFESSLIIEPLRQGELPFEAGARVTTGEFFPMLDVPLLYGSGWDAAADANAEAVVVLTRALNERLFGGSDSVGRHLSMQGRQFTVVGVIDTWEPTPRFYDPINGGFQEVQDMFIPFSLTRSLELNSVGSDWGWKAEEINSFDDWLNSESVWIQYFVELDNPRQRDDYVAHLDAYVGEQKAIGRFERPMNNHIYNVMEWMAYHDVVDDDARVLVGLSFLFLLVCVLSTVALLVTKFMGRKGEISVRRALGASRRAIFNQQIVEVAMIGLTGGMAGLLLAWCGLRGIDYLYDTPNGLVRLDWVMVGTAIVISIVSGVLAGLYPAWRVCRIPPAAQLKTQ
ncbi:MAG TPA: FtsX-like permease family protein [Woeseiaceae bacterium]|nr:FtsX-like permease family protein [Woeseiaceae bacterium]